MFRYAYLLLLVLIVAAPAICTLGDDTTKTASLQEAQEAFADGDYPRAAQIWYILANDEGVGEAQAALAAMYASGTGMVRNPVEAVKWYAKAPAQKLPQAQDELGMLLLNGLGTDRNIPRALTLFRQASAHLPRALSHLGLMYLNGYGVDRDEQTALEMFRKAEGQNDTKASIYLGYMQASGLGGLTRDPVKAQRCYLKAALAGDAEGMILAARGYRTDTLQDQLTALAWYQLAARYNGDVTARTASIELFRQISATPIDKVILEAEQGKAAALRTRGLMEETGFGLARDPEHAWVCQQLAGMQHEENATDLARLEIMLDSEQMERARQTSVHEAKRLGLQQAHEEIPDHP